MVISDIHEVPTWWTSVGCPFCEHGSQLLLGYWCCYRASHHPNLISSCSYGEWAHLSGYNLSAPLTKNVSSSSECSQTGKGAKGSQQQPPGWTAAPRSHWCQLPASLGLAVFPECFAPGQVWQVRALKGNGRRFLNLPLVYTLTPLFLQKGLWIKQIEEEKKDKSGILGGGKKAHFQGIIYKVIVC